MLKDLDEGLINFFSMHEGREIYLCWRLGDESVDSWYDVEEGYEQRKPVADLNKKV